MMISGIRDWNKSEKLKPPPITTKNFRLVLNFAKEAEI